MITRFEDIRGKLALTRGWHEREWGGRTVLAAAFGGDEMRVRVVGTDRAIIRIATEPYVFCHLLADGVHVARVGPECNPASVEVQLERAGTDLRFLRTAVSSGPFYVDALLLDMEAAEAVEFLPATEVLPETVFSTFGDSISGNCCIGDDAPYDPYGLSFGPMIAGRFGWQYLNAARDGSGVSTTAFDNPLAIDRVERDLIRHEPDVVLVFYGTNDIRGGVSAQRFGEDFHFLMEHIREGLPRARLATSTLLWNDMATAAQLEAYNDAIRRVSASLEIRCCEPGPRLARQDFDDGVHPNAQGQRKLADYFGEALASVLTEESKP